MRKILAIIFILIALSQLAEAQRYPFRTYSIEEGLSESVVYDIAQDDEGFIWLATGYGLNQFDGVRFQNYFEEQGLNSSRIRSLHKGNDGRIWIGSEAGVNYWQADSIYSIDVLAPLENTTVISIFQDRLGDMWFGTDGSGVWQLRDGSILTQYSTSNGLANNRVRAIAESPAGDLWFATRGGVTVLSNGNFRTYTIENGLPANRIRDIEIDNSGTVWIGSRNGLVKFKDDSLQVFNTTDGLVDNLIRSISITDRGELWIGTEGGLSNYDGSKFSRFNTSSGLSNNMIYSSIIDREGNIWLGTYGGGVSLFLGNYIASYDEENGLPNNLVTTFAEDGEGRQWIGMYGGGIVALESESFEDYGKNRQLPDDQIYKLFTDSKQRMWIGMREGLARLEDDEISVFSDEEFPFRKVRHILEASDSSFWISTYDDGIVRYKEGNFEQITTENGLPNNTVLAAVEDNEGAIWIATYGGVSRYFNGEFQNFSLQDGLPNNGVMNLLKDEEGRIWASTFGGIAWFDGQRFRSITTDDGLPDRVCYFIEQSEDGYYWIGTTNGVVRFDGQAYLNDEVNEQDQPVFQVINKEIGLVADELNLGAVYEDSEGRLWFGTVEGFSRFNPDLYKQNPAPPIVHIRGINASGREYQPGKEFTLSHQENYIEIFYTGINFTSPNQILYEYKLSGIDPEWQQTSSRSIKYPSLPPGEYTFKVHARSLNGSWSPEIEEVNFHITAPFWMQWWFWLIVTLMILGIIYLFYNYYRARKMVDIERMRVRIASDLHDDVGASLTEIALQSDFLQAGDADSEFKQSLEQIGKQCRKIVSSLDDIVWSIDARNDTLGDLTDRMQDYILHTLEPKNMVVHYDFDNLNMDNKLPVEVKENLYLIFKEAVNNIAKYSNGDKVDIKMENQNGSFEFFITDNGDTGKSTKKTGHGLRNMEMRAKRIGANITIDTNDGFTIQVKGKLHSN
ncbi:ligand-binding sensor domain-containing protein [Gracilimonas mengyeensis]|uniref:Ligand-binding sensor domain-containing protein n=1 Tax=Gracilimonas mengyeensis TaxID=1302730 RepID=A0A521DNX2_9BACT|nr:sensor histidine kinase [Gracilimonas mengyeensis]SMO73406.1 ligand-binding sensor domain-containing protein [Gracilimonas mengyeensis]